MLDGDLVEWFETVDESQRLAVFLDNAEPSRPIGGVRGLVHACRDLALDNRADFVVETWGNGDVLLYPRGVGNDWKLDRGEEFGLETTAAPRRSTRRLRSGGT